ncbi:hypothetical protein KUL42_03010 [Alteromonas sp. KUL42]|uniref:serine hydrolase domain-containing protein n=1 Tax=Alteromonas sp. KUL42 TaxID=2480797 RepID=UPI001036D06D|nr:serine hydrolase domain-containing protein [Alteromonas sp. KUL42]TAP38301.1 serine hydrolase [Alteromonas sp. KUL42]GEA05540.1 hypothetical protein KUL42_03010 [Alteromonas sp. KUL42]
MIRIAKYALLVFTAAIATNSNAETDQHASQFSHFIESTEAIIEQYETLNWFSGNVLITHKGEVIFETSVGWANREKSQPNSSCTRFNIGSIAKHYTAVLTLQLVEEGTLALTDQIATFDLGLKDSLVKGITIEHLLKHQAGFGDIFTPEYMSNPLAFDTLTKKIALLKDSPLLFIPGSDYRYSNYGYILLGAILEKVTGTSFSSLLNSRIFSVIGDDTSSLSTNDFDECQSKRYHYTMDRTLEETLFREVSGPDGGIESTTDALDKFYTTLVFSNKLLKRNGPAFNAYFGNQPSHITAFGGGTGVSAAVELLVENELTIVVLANSDELVAERISNRLAQIFKGEEVNSVTLPAKHFVFQQFKTLGTNEFKAKFKTSYKTAGYSEFIGKAINESGLALIKNGQHEDGLEIIKMLNHFFPKAPQAYDSLAYAHFLMGQLEKSRVEFKKALNLNPNFKSDYHQNNFN